MKTKLLDCTIRDGGYINNWNLVGISVLNDDAYYTDIYPDVIPGTLYGFTDSYYQTTDMEEGVGYWLRFNNVGMTAIFGENIEDVSINLNADWNLITGISDTVELFQFDDPEEIIIPGTLFGFNGTYEQVSTLIPGKGYWIRTINSGVISISPNFTRKNNYNGFDNRTKTANLLNINGQDSF